MSAIDLISGNTKYDILNVSSGELHSQEDVVKTIIKIWNSTFNLSIEPKYTTSKITDEIPKQVLVFDKLKSLGWKPTISLAGGISKIIATEFLVVAPTYTSTTQTTYPPIYIHPPIITYPPIFTNQYSTEE